MQTSRFTGTLTRVGTDRRIEVVDLGPLPEPAAGRGCPVVLAPGVLAPPPDRNWPVVCGVDLAAVKRVDLAYPAGKPVATVTFKGRAETVRRYGRDALALAAAVREERWVLAEVT